MLDDEIIKLFREIAVEESQYAPSFTVEGMRDVDVIMKDGSKIHIFCGERALVDCSGISPDGHFGIDNTMIEPIENIKEIKIARW